MTDTIGLLYSATGKRYVEEAIKSAGSYKRAMPNIPITIFTDLPEIASEENCFDACEQIKKPVHGPSDKFYALQNSPYDRTVFVDTDTWCLEQCEELFRVLDRFEFAAAHAPIRAMNFVPKGVPRCFPELNTGVLAFRRTKAVKELFAEWSRIYQDFRQRKKINRDQLSFRKALYFSDVNLTILPPEYNLRAVFSYFVGGFGPVKIIHARGGDLDRALKVVQPANDDPQIYPYVVSIDKQ